MARLPDLGAHLRAQIDPLLAAHNPATDLPIFSTLDHTTPTYVRNVGCWAYTIDLTPFSVWNSQLGSKMGGTLVAPDTVIYNEHYHPNVGETLRWVNIDNEVITRTITVDAHTFTPDTDTSVLLLDSDITYADHGISFCRVMPTYPPWYLAGIQRNPELVPYDILPILTTDQEKKATCGEWYKHDYVAISGTTSERMYHGAAVTDATRVTYAELPIAGDSSSPACAVINGKAVILGMANNVPASFSFYREDIDAAMATMGSAYTLTQADLTMFHGESDLSRMTWSPRPAATEWTVCQN